MSVLSVENVAGATALLTRYTEEVARLDHARTLRKAGDWSASIKLDQVASNLAFDEFEVMMIYRITIISASLQELGIEVVVPKVEALA